MAYSLYVILITITVSNAVSAKDYLVTGKSISIAKEINKKEVKDIFLGNKLFWEDGSRIQPIHLPINNKDFHNFLKNIIDMNTNQFLSYWRRKLFSGRAHPPKQISKVENILKFIVENPSSIAVIQKKPKTSSTTLTIIELD